MDGAHPRDTIHVEDAVSTRTTRAAQPLYASRIKVYPKRVGGFYRRVKWAMLGLALGAYYLIPWLRWDRGPGAPDQAVLIDLSGRRAYFFWIEIWPQEVYYLTGLLILGAIGLFLASTLLGRVWCGYACPQTVWTDLFLWVERQIEGDRNARIKLDAAPWDGRKLLLKVAKHAVWIVIAALTGGAWVMYYNDAPTVVREIATLQASSAVYLFFGLFTAATYLFAGWAREQVCTYMCPWPRFQAAMLDEHTYTVTYQAWRGEPRGKHKQGESWEGHGDCVDCNSCVAACPTGIDIRDGSQLECIGCGLCIDACNPVMEKIGRPGNLITFDTLANQQARAAKRAPMITLLRPRVYIYGAMLLVVATIMVAGLSTRSRVELAVLRDRAPLFVTLSNGSIRNAFTVKILNMSREQRSYALEIAGLNGATIGTVGTVSQIQDGAGDLAAAPDSVATMRVLVSVPGERLAAESTPITFVMRDRGTGEVTRHSSVFIGPSR